ncbi:MAG TPA: hypothetical protein DEP18_03240 [Flavobacteriales bacterium]|nr:hypothetical protein [Flavobacteriales bacterium]
MIVLEIKKGLLLPGKAPCRGNDSLRSTSHSIGTKHFPVHMGMMPHHIAHGATTKTVHHNLLHRFHACCFGILFIFLLWWLWIKKKSPRVSGGLSMLTFLSLTIDEILLRSGNTIPAAMHHCRHHNGEQIGVFHRDKSMLIPPSIPNTGMKNFVKII